MRPSSAVLDRAPAAIRILAFVEARGITGVLRNLLDFALAGRMQADPIEFELATYWRSRHPGKAGAATADIQEAIDAAANRGFRTHVLHERFAGDPRLVRQVRALIRRTKPDIVETHHVKSHALLAACGPGAARWVAFHHGYTSTTLKTRALNLLDRWSLTRPAVVVTPCEAFANDLRSRGIDRTRIVVVHNSVKVPPLSLVPDLRPALGLTRADRVVLAVGRLSREKAHRVLLDAFARPPLAALANVHLVIAGDGRERRRLESRAAAVGVARVHFVGHQPDVWPYYRLADLVALPSDSEGSPVALLEAMAAGKPIVATRVGGVPEIVEHERSALLVPPRNPDALARALADILERPAFGAALAARARQVVEDRFTVAARGRVLSPLYHGLCQS